LNFVQNEILPNAARITAPKFELLGMEVEEEVPTLQMFIAQNLLNVVAGCVECIVRPTERGSSVGNPDGYIVKEGRISIVYEIKGKWSLNPDLFLNGRIDNIDNSNSQYRFIYNALNQIYTYMVWNHLQYGMLSSFDYTFFLKRVKVENASDGFEQLLISTGISHNSTNPTILQSLAYLMSLADGVTFKSPPPSPLRMSPRTSRTASARNSPRTSRTRMESQPSADDNDENSPEPHYSLEDFSIKSVLGQGRTKVYYEAKNRIALKAIDLYKQSSMIDELDHEMEVYDLLSDLQGSYIPTLLLHGFYEGGMYFIGFSLCGNVPEKLDTKQKRTLLRAMDLIHSRGIVHNDIKKENILVDGSGNPFIIDFGFATINTTLDAQNQEKAQLQALLELF
jgi:predicted Ser/Thr protein kinase